VIRGNNEAQTAFDTNSTGCVGPAPDQAGYQLACTEVWGGNNIADELLKLPGLVGLVHSKPIEPATSGGDVYYVSVCDKRVLSRVVLADVAGHGEAVTRVSTRLRMLVKKYINTFDQSALMREINEAFYKQNEDLAQYATAEGLSHDCRTGELIFASAGHPPTLWYHASQKEWGWLHESIDVFLDQRTQPRRESPDGFTVARDIREHNTREQTLVAGRHVVQVTTACCGFDGL
jgi:hypothetical protein